MPAFFCGVFGHKPSSGLVPNTGQYPDAENEAQRYLSTGPIARRAGDLRPLVEVLAGHPLPTGERAEMTDIDVHVVATDAGGSPGGRPHRDVMRAVGLSAAALESRGARVRGLDAPYLRDALDIWAAAMHAAADTPFREMLADGTEISIPREILACLRGRSDHTLPALGLALIEDVPVRLMPKRTRRLLARLPEARHALTERLGPSGILLFPPYPTPAPRHGRALLPPTRWCGTAVFNVLELPVTQVPTGLGADGLPVGVQVAAAHGNDHLTISVAETLEAELGGWVPPPARRVHEPGGPPHETRSNGR